MLKRDRHAKEITLMMATEYTYDTQVSRRQLQSFKDKQRFKLPDEYELELCHSPAQVPLLRYRALSLLGVLILCNPPTVGPNASG